MMISAPVFAKYAPYFHDGSLIAVHHSGKHVLFSMWSAEMDPDDVVDAIPLSSDNRFKGHLHIRNISSIILDDALFPSRPLKMLDDSGDIFHLSVESEKVELQIIWEKWTPKCKETGFSTLLITGEEVYWEPDLDLVDPYW